jgi:hypothetical protein
LDLLVCAVFMIGDFSARAEHSHHATALSACSDQTSSRLSQPGANNIKHNEHAAVLQLVAGCAATHVATASGSWADHRTWNQGRVPGADARVLIPRGVTVQMDADLHGTALDWTRVDGQLAFSTTTNTALSVRTLVVSDDGSVTIGSPDRPVEPAVKARILLAPRARDRHADPFDLAGGLISQGRVIMVGPPKTPFAAVKTSLRKGTEVIELAEPARGWELGDELLVPGTDAYSDQDELRTIVRIDAEGRTVVLDEGLEFTHAGPDGVAIPIANLTRNIEVSSVESQAAAARAHVMIMHVQTGTLFDGVAFRHLGRTDARRAHSFPEMGPDGATRAGTDVNTIGRYAVHFHVRSGARADVPPHVVRNSVVVDSPKYGVVSHGAHLLAEDNVSFRVAGSHFVAENGSEIGTFRRNMAVRSAGSSELLVESRMSIYDFGHGGHGFWLQSGGVELSDNWASGHAGAGIFKMGMPFREHGREVFFDGRNLSDRAPGPHPEQVRISDVDFYFARNTVAGSGKGLDVWYHQIYSADPERAVVEGLTVWNSAETAVSIPYTRRVALRNLRLVADGKGGVGIEGNDLTESVVVQGADIRGFGVGIRLPRRGDNAVRNAVLDNAVNAEIATALSRGRHIRLENVEFAGADSVDIATQTQLAFGNLGMLFERDRIDLRDRDGRNRRIYFPHQQPGHVLFADAGPQSLRGLTNAEINRRFGVAPGGVLAPDEAVRLDRSNALSAEAAPTLALDGAREPPEDANVFRHFVTAVDGTPNGWELVSTRTSEKSLAYATNQPAKFMLRRGLVPPRIHPEDVRYGYRVHGFVLEPVNGQLTLRNWEREFRNLVVWAGWRGEIGV